MRERCIWQKGRNLKAVPNPHNRKQIKIKRHCMQNCCGAQEKSVLKNPSIISSSFFIKFHHKVYEGVAATGKMMESPSRVIEKIAESS